MKNLMIRAPSRLAIAQLTGTQRAIIVAHANGDVPLKANYHKPSALDALVKRRLLRFVPHGARRPRFTALTDVGRFVCAAILAEYADALAGAGLAVGGETPMQVLERLKAARGAKTGPETPVSGFSLPGAAQKKSV